MLYWHLPSNNTTYCLNQSTYLKHFILHKSFRFHLQALRFEVNIYPCLFCRFLTEIPAPVLALRPPCGLLGADISLDVCEINGVTRTYWTLHRKGPPVPCLTFLRTVSDMIVVIACSDTAYCVLAQLLALPLCPLFILAACTTPPLCLALLNLPYAPSLQDQHITLRLGPVYFGTRCSLAPIPLKIFKLYLFCHKFRLSSVSIYKSHQAR